MPQEFNRLVENFAQRVPGVVIAIRARKHNHPKFHRADSPLENILSQRAPIFPDALKEVIAHYDCQPISGNSAS
jgi:hypothetical protein